MKKFLISTLCYLILFNSFIAIFSDSVYAKETLIQEIKKQYTIKKENLKKTTKELKDSGFFKNGQTIGITVGIVTIAVIGIGKCISRLYNHAIDLKEEIPIESDNNIEKTTVVGQQTNNVPPAFIQATRDNFEEEEYGD